MKEPHIGIHCKAITLSYDYSRNEKKKSNLIQSIYNYSKITYPRENTIVSESCFTKLTLELDLLMGFWNKKIMTKGHLTVFSFFLQHSFYRFYVSLTTVC